MVSMYGGEQDLWENSVALWHLRSCHTDSGTNELLAPMGGLRRTLMGCVDVFVYAALTRLTPPFLGVLRGTWALICLVDTPHSHLSLLKKRINTTALMLESSSFRGRLFFTLHPSSLGFFFFFGWMSVTLNSRSKVPNLRSEKAPSHTGIKSVPKTD